MMDWVVILLLAAVGGASFLRYRDLLYPPVVHCATWGVVLLVGVLWGQSLDAVSTSVLLLIALSALTFAAGAYIATWTLRVEESWAPPPGSSPLPGFGHLLTLTAAVGLPFFIARAVVLGANGPTDSFLVNVRLAMTGDVFTGLQATGSFGVVEYLVPVAIVAAVLQVARARRMDRWAWLSFAIALTYAVLFTGRTVAMLLLVAVAGLRLIRREVSVARGALVAVVAGAAFFVGVGALLGKLGVESAIAATDVLLSYTVAGLRALGQVISDGPAPTGGANMLRTVLAALAGLGFELQVPALVQQPAYVPIPTNVYTVYHPYVLDFGFFGGIALPWVLGVIHGASYRMAARHGGGWSVVFAFLLFPLMMQVFQDQYFSLLSLWVQVSVLAGTAFWLPHLATASGRLRRYLGWRPDSGRATDGGS